MESLSILGIDRLTRPSKMGNVLIWPLLASEPAGVHLACALMSYDATLSLCRKGPVEHPSGLKWTRSKLPKTRRWWCQMSWHSVAIVRERTDLSLRLTIALEALDDRIVMVAFILKRTVLASMWCLIWLWTKMSSEIMATLKLVPPSH